MNAKLAAPERCTCIDIVDGKPQPCAEDSLPNRFIPACARHAAELDTEPDGSSYMAQVEAREHAAREDYWRRRRRRGK